MSMLQEVPDMLDSYERFFFKFNVSKKQFFNFGIRETIYAPIDKAQEGWDELKRRISNNDTVYIRGFGWDSKGSHLFQEFYSQVFGNKNVKIDPSNNKEPTTVIRKMTGYSKIESVKYETIRNYQVSHIFGRTKNIFMFTAPWNIVYLPKLIDPFTGHEAKGDLIKEYQTLFRQKSYAHFKPLIEEYNKIISDPVLQTRIDEYFENISKSSHPQEDIDKLKKSVQKELSPINSLGK